MRLRRALRRIAAALGFVGACVAVLPRETLDLDRVRPFDPDVMEGDPAAYLAAREAAVDGIVPGTEKRIVWADAAGARQEWSVVYLHGFSATSEEIRPVPADVAGALGANLVLTRLDGHGRDGAALADADADLWMADVAEAYGVARAVGERVLVIATSTGGTLAVLAASRPDIFGEVAGIAAISPNFGVDVRGLGLLTWPAASWWLPLILGETGGFEPANADHARYWTETFPVRGLLPMAASVVALDRVDPGAIGVPLMVVYSPADQVVSPEATRRMAAAWGGPVRTMEVEPGPWMDPSAHVIAGEILSPGPTPAVTRALIDWARGL